MNFIPKPRANLAWGGMIWPGVRSWKAMFFIEGVCVSRVKTALKSADLFGRGRKLYFLRISVCWWATVCISASCCI